jgi:hypothetical protein
MRIIIVAAMCALAACSSNSPNLTDLGDLYSTTCPVSGGTPCTAPSDIVCVTAGNEDAFLAAYKGSGSDTPPPAGCGNLCSSGGGCQAIGTAPNGDTAYCCSPAPLNPEPDASYVQP